MDVLLQSEEEATDGPHTLRVDISGATTIYHVRAWVRWLCVTLLALATFVTSVAVMAANEDGDSTTPMLSVTATVWVFCLLGAT